MHKIIREPEFAARIRKRRIELGFTQSDCCRRLGCIRQAWNNWEMGTTKPGPKLMRDVALLLDVTPEWLLYGDDGEISSVLRRVATTARTLARDVRYLDRALKTLAK